MVAVSNQVTIDCPIREGASIAVELQANENMRRDINRISRHGRIRRIINRRRTQVRETSHVIWNPYRCQESDNAKHLHPLGYFRRHRSVFSYHSKYVNISRSMAIPIILNSIASQFHKNMGTLNFFLSLFGWTIHTRFCDKPPTQFCLPFGSTHYTCPVRKRAV